MFMGLVKRQYLFETVPLSNILIGIAGILSECALWKEHGEKAFVIVRQNLQLHLLSPLSRFSYLILFHNKLLWLSWGISLSNNSRQTFGLITMLFIYKTNFQK